MKILLTGGAGYIGSHTIIELYKAGHSVVVVDNLVNSNQEALRRVSKIIGEEFHLKKQIFEIAIGLITYSVSIR